MFKQFEYDVTQIFEDKIHKFSQALLEIIIPYTLVIIFFRLLMLYLFASFSRMKYNIISLILCLKKNQLEAELNQLNSIIKDFEADQMSFI